MIESIVLFLKLAVGHFLADYPLQGDFLAKAKNHWQPIPVVPWYQAMMGHSAIQAGMVWLITGKLWVAGVEFVLHFAIDFAKNNSAPSNAMFNLDQACHLLCKLAYSIV